MARLRTIVAQQAPPPGSMISKRRLVHCFTPLLGAALFLLATVWAWSSPVAGQPSSKPADSPAGSHSSADSTDVPSAAALYEMSGTVAESLKQFFALWRMTMTPEPAHDVDPFAADMHMWRKGPNFRHETEMPPEILSVSMGAATTGGMPACLVSIVREEDGAVYCQLLDGGWQAYPLDGEFDFGADIPFVLTGTPEEAGLVLSGVVEDEWNGRPAWRIDGDMDEAMSQVELPFPVKTSAAMWVDQESMLVIASESRIELPAEALGGVMGGFVIRLELIEFAPGADIPDELFNPPSGVSL